MLPEELLELVRAGFNVQGRRAKFGGGTTISVSTLTPLQSGFSTSCSRGFCPAAGWTVILFIEHHLSRDLRARVEPDAKFSNVSNVTDRFGLVLEPRAGGGACTSVAAVMALLAAGLGAKTRGSLRAFAS